MRTVWKYTLNKYGSTGFEVPYGAKPLSVGCQDDVPFIWFEVDDSVGAVDTYHVEAVTTGGDAPTNVHSKFIGTLFLAGGHYVIHIYVRRL